MAAVRVVLVGVRRFVLVAAMLAGSGVGAMPCMAQELPVWELGVGGTAFVQPDYIGSGEYGVRGLPFPWLVYRSERLNLSRGSIQTLIFGTDRFRLDVSGFGQTSVDSSKNDLREGMPDLDWRFQLGPNLRIRLAESEDARDTLHLELPARAVVAFDSDDVSYAGIVASPTLRARIRRGPWRGDFRAGLEFLDRKNSDYVYGVATRYATDEREAYDGDGGYAGVKLSAGVNRYWERLYAGVYAHYTNIDGASFGDSPLVESDHAVTVGIALAWVLWKSEATTDTAP